MFTSVQQNLSKFNIKNQATSPLTIQIFHHAIFGCFRLRKVLHGGKCNVDSEVILAMLGFLKEFPEKFFSTCFEKCSEQCNRCKQIEGKYFQKE